jgi:polyhydroxyalkanoate synthesis regulator phasin
MPAPRSASGRSKTQKPGRAAPRRTAAKTSTTASRQRSKDGIATFAEQLLNRVFKPLDLVVISRARIQETLDEAAERGRVTRHDANELVTELVRRGRQQTDDLFANLESLLGRGRGQIGSATKQSVDRIVRGADRARRSIGVGPSFPVSGYDELTAGQVEQRLDGLKPAELRRVRDYERRHANRKTVLDAIERALDKDG